MQSVLHISQAGPLLPKLQEPVKRPKFQLCMVSLHHSFSSPFGSIKTSLCFGKMESCNKTIRAEKWDKIEGVAPGVLKEGPVSELQET